MTEIIMKNQNETHKQAVVLARMGQTLAQVERIAKVRGWHGAVKRRFVNEFLHLRAAQTRAM